MHTPQKENLILELTFQFALTIITFTEDLEAKRKFNLANQLLKVVLLSALVFGKHKVTKAGLILYTR